MNLFVSSLFSDPWYFWTTVLIVVFSVCCHEFMHAWTALREGDPTAAENGHLTLNPLRQMGLFSLIALLVLGLAWGAVPVNPLRMRHRYSHMLVALAGPLTNLALGVVFTVLFAAAVLRFAGNDQAAGAINFLSRAAVINMVLAILNMLPVPGLDGWTVFTALFPKMLSRNLSEFARGAVFVVIALLFVGIRYIFLAGHFLFETLAVGLIHLLRLIGTQ